MFSECEIDFLFDFKKVNGRQLSQGFVLINITYPPD